ncbi:MAG: transcriptional regulator [Opitutae bacterium]|nr:transcriptional regulator [Opitutae bacterium]
MKREFIGPLNPTLWRTCRILSGKTRLALLRRLLQEPGQTVTQLAKAEGLSLPRASQELRRLHSRGLLQAERIGAFVRYWPQPDPQVSTAKPILQAVRDMWDRFPLEGEAHIQSIAEGLSYPRRIDMVRELKKGAIGGAALQAAVRLPTVSLWRHFRALQQSGWVEREGRLWRVAPNDYPLAECLMNLL